MQPKLAIVGAGVMGSAILDTIITRKIFPANTILVIDLDQKKLTRLKKLKVQISTNPADAADAKIILLAIKPQQLSTACKNWTTNALVISILAGTKITSLKKITGSVKIARAMPNTPAQISAGITGWLATKKVSITEKKLVQKILTGLGTEIELNNEKQLDTVTAISGSGPAYFFAFAEALEIAAKKLGLGRNAYKFVAETFFGAAQLAKTSEKKFSELRKNVTSKGGTTAAALEIFEKEKFVKIIEKAAQAAKKKSEKLSKGE